MSDWLDAADVNSPVTALPNKVNGVPIKHWTMSMLAERKAVGAVADLSSGLPYRLKGLSTNIKAILPREILFSVFKGHLQLVDEVLLTGQGSCAATALLF